jgi:hypothetical protein
MSKTILICVGLALILDVCGYKRAGKGKGLPSDIKIIAVPVFQNTRLRYRVEQRFTNAVIEEITKRARGLHVTTNPENADAVLNGDIRSLRTAGVLLDDQARTRVWEVRVIVSVVLRDNRSKKILYQNPRLIFEGEYQLSEDPESFFNEENPAVDRIAREFAQTLISTVMEGL